VIGLAPRNVFAFLFFVVTVLGLFMVALILLAYAGVRVGFLSGLWVEWPGDAVKVVLGVLPVLFFVWLRIFRKVACTTCGRKVVVKAIDGKEVRICYPCELPEAECSCPPKGAKEAELEETEAEEVKPEETEAEGTEPEEPSG